MFDHLFIAFRCATTNQYYDAIYRCPANQLPNRTQVILEICRYLCKLRNIHEIDAREVNILSMSQIGEGLARMWAMCDPLDVGLNVNHCVNVMVSEKYSRVK